MRRIRRASCRSRRCPGFELTLVCVMPPILNPSNDSANDSLLGTSGLCGTPAPGAYLDCCGYGTRLPFLVISPFARQNFVDFTLNDTTSILRFIEGNWGLGRLGDRSFDALAGSILNMFNFKGPAEDGRSLRRYRRRWKIERLFGWLQNFRRLVTRYEHSLDNYSGAPSRLRPHPTSSFMRWALNSRPDIR